MKVRKKIGCLFFRNGFCGTADCFRGSGTWRYSTDNTGTITKDIQKYMGHCGK